MALAQTYYVAEDDFRLTTVEDAMLGLILSFKIHFLTQLYFVHEVELFDEYRLVLLLKLFPK